MCEYCGCQQNEVIAQLTAEHDQLRELSHDLSAATNTGDLARARHIAAQMQAVMGPHTHVEEVGLFPALSADFGPQLDQLTAEHRDIDAALSDLATGRPRPDWRFRTQLALAHLFDHILKEQDGVFPAALATLTTADWDTLEAARNHAHAPALGTRA